MKHLTIQLLYPIASINKSLISTETHYSNMEKFHHYCFVHEVKMITDHKLMVVMYKKDIVSLSHTIQQMLLWIQQYNFRILYKTWPQLFIADWLLRHNHEKIRDEDIPGMCITISTIKSCIEIPDCMRSEETRQANLEDKHLSSLAEFILHSGHSEMR